MQPASIDLEIYQGASFKQTFIWNAGTTPNINPVNLNGCTMKMQIRKKAKDENILDELTIENNKIVLDDPVNGKFSIDLTGSETESYTFTSAVYDLKIIFSDDNTVRFCQGSIIVYPAVTRP